VLRRYALRNALVPSIQMFAIVIQYLFGGVIVTEVVFGFPGLGQGLVNATLAHDTPEVQAIAMIFAAIYVTILIFADFLVVILIPRLRTQM
jgi:peptide/nickel transport system permease protein